MLDAPDLPLFIKTLPGLEPVLEREVKFLGGRDVKAVKRGVKATGDIGFVYKANLALRSALRVLVQVKEIPVQNADALYKVMRRIPWERYFDSQATMMVDATVYSKVFTNSLYVAQKAKDGIADRFREKQGQRPNVDLQNPQVRINVHISQKHCTVSLDSSGPSLHKRNYRSARIQAPLSEVLAAGILQLTGWEGHLPLIDPMCGSGTFLVEGAFLAAGLPPNLLRKEFAFRHWKGFAEELLHTIIEGLLSRESENPPTLFGFDKTTAALYKTRQNIRSALLEDRIELAKADFTKFNKREELPEKGMIIMNPPYDLKMEADIPQLYGQIGDTLKQQFTGYTAFLYTGSAEGIKNVGLKASQKTYLPNAQRDAWLVRYDLY